MSTYLPSDVLDTPMLLMLLLPMTVGLFMKIYYFLPFL